MLDLLFHNIPQFIIALISLIMAIDIHEFSHALVADYLGDPTPRLQKRLTLNPLAHIDRIGIILMILFGFGYGRAVQIDPFNLKNPRKDQTWIALAGPFSNLICAITLSLLFRSFTFFNLEFLIIIGNIFLSYLILWNVILGILNLVPLYPLDGFQIVAGLLPEEQSYKWVKLKRYGMFPFLLLILPLSGSTPLISVVLKPIYQYVLPLLPPGNIFL